MSGWLRRLLKKTNYPGNGPFSDLPPWERPGWVFGGRGRGFCRLLLLLNQQEEDSNR